MLKERALHPRSRRVDELGRKPQGAGVQGVEGGLELDPIRGEQPGPLVPGNQVSPQFGSFAGAPIDPTGDLSNDVAD
jgi:hypothetical protein